MDDNFRRKHVRKFFEGLSFDYTLLKEHVETELELSVTEDLKLLENHEWDVIKDILGLKTVSARKLDSAVK